MKRLTALLLLIPALAWASINWNTADITTWNGVAITAFNGVEVAPADDYSDITFWWTCEDDEIGASDYSAGDTTATLGSGAAINTDANASGTNGLDLPTAGDYAQFAVSSADLIDRAEGSLMVKFRWAGMPGVNVDMLKASGSDGTLSLESATTNDLRLSFYNNPTTYNLALSAADLTTDTWYLVVARWKPADNDRFIGVYNATTGALIDSAEDLATGFSTGDADYTIINVGDNGANAQDAHVDQIVGISNSYSRDWLALRNLTESPR